MKLRLFSTVQLIADAAIAGLDNARDRIHSFRVWIWHKSTEENIRLINIRQTRKNRFD